MKHFWLIACVVLLLGATCSKETKKGADQMNTKEIERKAETSARPVVRLTTDFGVIDIELRPDVAPKTCENFIKLVKEGFYDSLTFHRIIPGFVIQGGDPKGDGTGGPGYTVPAEFSDLKHVEGAVATARQSDQVNPTKASSGSQFYIVCRQAPHLDGQYTIFGMVIAGIDVVHKIENVPLGNPQMGKPAKPVYILKAEVIR